jgi:crossover junction endodeoxyribonuclease RuvC
VCAENGLPWFEYTPAEVKTAVSGNGSAEKRQVKFMVSKIMKIQQEIKPDDAADALAIAICHLNRGRSLGL